MNIKIRLQYATYNISTISLVIKYLRCNKITSKGFLANLKSLGHVFYREKRFTEKFPWRKGLN